MAASKRNPAAKANDPKNASESLPAPKKDDTDPFSEGGLLSVPTFLHDDEYSEADQLKSRELLSTPRCAQLTNEILGERNRVMIKAKAPYDFRTSIMYLASTAETYRQLAEAVKNSKAKGEPKRTRYRMMHAPRIETTHERVTFLLDKSEYILKQTKWKMPNDKKEILLPRRVPPSPFLPDLPHPENYYTQHAPRETHRVRRFIFNAFPPPESRLPAADILTMMATTPQLQKSDAAKMLAMIAITNHPQKNNLVEQAAAPIPTTRPKIS